MFYQKIKRIVLTILSFTMAFTTILQWDVDAIKANQEVYESLLPEVSGIPQQWTNEMIQLSVEQNDSDFMYSFSDREGYYQWQSSPISNYYGQNKTVYVSIMNQNGSISQEKEVELTKLDLFQPEVDVTFSENNGSVVFQVNASDDLSGVKEYSFDGGKTWQVSHQYTVSNQQEVIIQVKDNAGNIKNYEKVFSVDATLSDATIYSLQDTIDEKGNRYHEVKVENANSSYEYNLNESKQWKNDTKVLVPYKKDHILTLKRRNKTNGNARGIVTEDTTSIRAISYPRVGGPAILYEDGVIRLVGQGTAFNYTDIAIDSENGAYTIDGYQYQMFYSFDLENWTAYSGPFVLQPSDYGKTLYARLVGANNGYISSEILENKGVQKLVTAYQNHPTISDKVLSYDQIQDLLAAHYEFNYVAMQFENETNRYQYMVDSLNVVEFALSQNIYRSENNYRHMAAIAQSTANGNVYIFSDLIGNQALYNVQTDLFSYYDKDAELTYTMSNGVLNSIRDNNDNQLTITRTDINTIITDFNGRQYIIDEDGIHMPSDTLISGYQYIDENQVYSTIDIEDACDITYGTFAGMQVITRLDYESGYYIAYTYGIEDNFYTVLTETTPQGSEKYYYNPEFELVIEEDKYAYRTNYVYNNKKNVVQEVKDGITTNYKYDESEENLTEISQGLHSETAQDNVVEPEVKAEFAYDDNGRLISEKYENENEIRYTYDNKGNLIQVSEIKEDGNEVITATYDTKGNILTETDVEQNIRNTYTYNAYNDMLSITEIDLEDTTDTSTFTYSYDEAGRIIREVSEDDTNTYEYNQLGDLTLQYVDEKYTRNVYNTKGQLKVTIEHEDYDVSKDGLQQTNKTDIYNDSNVGIRYSYTPLNQIKTTITSDNMATIYVYDEYGNLQKESIYNKDNYEEETDHYMYQIVYKPNGLIERYRVNGVTKLLNTYDDKENLTKVTYSNSQNVEYTYSNEDNPSNDENNIDGLLKGVKFKNDSTNRFTYNYDKEGILSETIDVKNNTKTVCTDQGYTLYDQSDNSIIQSYTIDDDVITETVLENTYTSTMDNDIITIKKNENTVLNTTKDYASNGKLEELQTTLTNGNQSITLTETPTFDEDVVTDYAISGIGNTTYHFQYTYDEDKNIKKEYGSFSDSFYTYDANDQLIRVIDSVNNKTTVFQYDIRGNLTKETIYSKSDYASNGSDATPLQVINYAYENSDWADQLTKVNDNVITYDGAGNRTSYDGWSYTWEGGRQLASMSKDDTMITYKYDDSGIRTEKKVNNKTIKYTTVDGRITSQDDGTNKLYFYYDENESLLGFEHNGTPYLYIKNIQGDIYGISDITGTLLVQYEYDAWGQVKTITGNQIIGQLNPMRYRGYYYDEESGLYYLQSRYYDASVRRFINADTFKMLGLSETVESYNLYLYCENNPINYLDPLGKAKLGSTESKLIKSVVYKGNKRVKQNSFLFTTSFSFLSHTYKVQYSLTAEKYISIDLKGNAMNTLAASFKFGFLAKEMINITFAKSKYGLRGRSKRGVEAELIINFAAYSLGFRDRYLLIGGTNPSIKGHSEDANSYEFAGVINIASDIVGYLNKYEKYSSIIEGLLKKLKKYF